MDINEDKKKYQAATDMNEERKKNKKYLQSKIIFFVVCSVSVAFILEIIGFFVYRHVTGPSLKKMMNYMEEKYGEEFEILAVGTEPSGSSKSNIYELQSICEYINFKFGSVA